MVCRDGGKERESLESSFRTAFTRYWIGMARVPGEGVCVAEVSSDIHRAYGVVVVSDAGSGSSRRGGQGWQARRSDVAILRLETRRNGSTIVAQLFPTSRNGGAARVWQVGQNGTREDRYVTDEHRRGFSGGKLLRAQCAK